MIYIIIISRKGCIKIRSTPASFARADPHLFETTIVIGWKNNRDGDIIMPLSLKTIGSAGYMHQ